jgi:uncharacterized protein YidB (DUF937 family)
MTDETQQRSQPDLGGMLSGLLGGQGGGSGLAKLLPAVLGMVGGAGGLGGVLSKLQQGGLGDQVKSWVSPDSSNQKVSEAQVTEALGPEKINQLAEQAQVSPQEAASGLAQVLPTAVDKLTPQGEVPAEQPKFDVGQLQQQISKLLGGNSSK